jgi:hypothetical protein
MRSMMVVAAAVGALVAGAGAATADTMNPVLGAKLAGMGEHGVVNLHSKAAKGELCWTFDLSTSGITAASIRDAHGMIVVKLGKAYKPKSCAMVAKSVLRMIEAKPASYRVWVDTPGHPGDLRGKLHTGMADM